MQLTQPADWLQRPYVGYVVNTLFSQHNETILAGLMAELEHEFGAAVFCMPEESLHITLLDWIAPLVDYDGQDKSALFAQIREAYDQAVIEAVQPEQVFSVTFDEIHVSPSTIYITGRDDGQFQRIRGQFLANAQLLPGTKQPPTIIHSSLARFTESIPMDRVQQMLSGMEINLTQSIERFQLVHTMREPMLEFKILKEYHLGVE